MEGNQVCKWKVDGQYVCYQLGNGTTQHAPIPGNVPYLYKDQMQAPFIYDTTNLYQKPPYKPVESFTSGTIQSIQASNQKIKKLAQWDCGWPPLHSRKGWFFV